MNCCSRRWVSSVWGSPSKDNISADLMLASFSVSWMARWTLIGILGAAMTATEGGLGPPRASVGGGSG